MRLLVAMIVLLGVVLPPSANATLDVTDVGDIDTLAVSFGSGLYGTVTDDAGNIYVADLPGARVWKITPAGVVSAYAGTGTPGFSGDAGAATSAELNGPIDVALDSVGNLYIADRDNNRIRMVDASDGKIYTVAGSGPTGYGNGGYTGDDGPATSATLNYPEDVAVDASGNVYINDSQNGVIRKVDSGGTITTHVEYISVNNLDVTADGILFVADGDYEVVHKVDAGGTVTTYAGNGSEEYSGDGGLATSASLDDPVSVAVAPNGDVYVGTFNDNRIRKIDHTTHYISTVAGDGSSGYSGDGGPATAAEFEGITGLSVDSAGNLIVTDYYNDAVRVVAYADTDGDTFPDLVDNFPLIYSNCLGQQATIAGDDTPNLLDGTSGPDVIVGNGGADTINGNGGKDLICAGTGADVVHGGGGRDRIYGEGGNDTIYGDKKSDRLYGGNGDDAIYGNGGGHDRLSGNKGTDSLNGGKGDNDECSGGEAYAACEIIA